MVSIPHNNDKHMFIRPSNTQIFNIFISYNDKCKTCVAGNVLQLNMSNTFSLLQIAQL